MYITTIVARVKWRESVEVQMNGRQKEQAFSFSSSMSASRDEEIEAAMDIWQWILDSRQSGA